MKPMCLSVIAAAAALWLSQPASGQDATNAKPDAEPKTAAELPADAPKEAPADTSNVEVPIAADEPATPEKEMPLNLWADQIVYEGNGFTCTGNVVLVRGESRMECEKIIGTIADVEKTDKDTGKKKSEKAITDLTASGAPIKMDSGLRKARCLKAVYDLIEGKIILTGSKEEPPILMEQDRTARGERIIFLVNENKVIIEKGPIEIPVSGNMPGLPK